MSSIHTEHAKLFSLHKNGFGLCLMSTVKKLRSRNQHANLQIRYSIRSTKIRGSKELEASSRSWLLLGKIPCLGLEQISSQEIEFFPFKSLILKILIQNTCKKILEFYSNWRNFNKNKLKPSKPYIYCLQLKGQMESQEKLYSSLNYEIFYPSIPFLISKMNQQNACNYAKQIINSQFALDSVLEQQYLWDAFFLLLLRNNDIVKI